LISPEENLPLISPEENLSIFRRNSICEERESVSCPLKTYQYLKETLLAGERVSHLLCIQ
jgi:hypothetical protein